MKRDNNKHTHFSDSRPQSLSFYEDEKIPEELSGNLELLSPEERKHYRRRKEYIDLDLERNVYNNMQVHFCDYNQTFLNRCRKNIGGKSSFHTIFTFFILYINTLIDKSCFMMKPILKKLYRILLVILHNKTSSFNYYLIYSIKKKLLSFYVC